jgi:hypothetical protein
MLLRHIVITSLLTTGFIAVASAQSSVKLTGIEAKIELVGTGKLPPANPFASLAKPSRSIRTTLERDLVAARTKKC